MTFLKITNAAFLLLLVTSNSFGETQTKPSGETRTKTSHVSSGPNEQREVNQSPDEIRTALYSVISQMGRQVDIGEFGPSGRDSEEPGIYYFSVPPSKIYKFFTKDEKIERVEFTDLHEFKSSALFQKAVQPARQNAKFDLEDFMAFVNQPEDGRKAVGIVMHADPGFVELKKDFIPMLKTIEFKSNASINMAKYMRQENQLPEAELAKQIAQARADHENKLNSTRDRLLRWAKP